MSTLKKNQTLTKHNDTRIDPYFWMRERDSKEVLDFLKKENQHVEVTLKYTLDLQQNLFNEMRSRIKEEDTTAPVRNGEFYYYTKYLQGKEYPIYVRKGLHPNDSEKVIYDVNDLSLGHSFFNCSGPMMSPNHQIAALACDSQGRRFFTLRFLDLETGKFFPQEITQTTGNLVWSPDNKTVFFSKQHPETLRSYQVYRFQLESNPSSSFQQPELVYEEMDETFSVNIHGSKFDQFIFIESQSKVTSEVRFIPASEPFSHWKILAPRERNHEYSVQDGGDQFYILSNWNAQNFRLFSASFTSNKKQDWVEQLAHDPDLYLEDFDVFQSFLTLEARKNGLTQILVFEPKTKKVNFTQFPDECYVTELHSLPDPKSDVFRYSYQSLINPPAVIDCHFQNETKQIVKQKEVPGYNSQLYTTKRWWAPAQDGTLIPMSILFQKNRPPQPGPLLLYGYGSYGINLEPWFDSSILSLVDRGFIFVRAHIRGGSEMGRHWYESGKLLNKKNTFTDFIDCADFLIKKELTSPQHLYAMGGSAGGLLMGAVMNLRPELFNGVIAAVPFVDVVTTMLDDTIPLTTSEYDEWGNPNDETFYNYIKSYSPYDNIENKEYPHLLVTTGYHDSQVQYWEPAKWVAKLRDQQKNKNKLLLFKTEMEAGHSGPSGRFQRLKEIALEYAFCLTLEGIS